MVEAQQKKLQQEKKQTLILAIVTLALVAAIVGAIVLTTVLSNRPIYDLADKKSYTVSETATNYVKLNVSYTDDEGKKHNGDIIVKLDPESAPITVANFQKLVGEGFYDGLIFHRVIENFMIQGGDPKGNGTGGSDEDIKGEFSANGVNNTILHERGVISMARSGEQRDAYGNVIDYGYNSASSQFFIIHKTSPHLDGQYAAFGHVVFGMTSVDGIATIATNSNDKPLKNAIIESAVFVNYTE
ncbi:MAG: peptidylprolyl isomerase [Clostridia bacterium]|nr:peptidylprolyl isomerase [Clostridia bacterium]